MDDCIEREPLLKAFKEKCCQDCPGGYSHQQCHSWCDAASEIEMIENAPAVNNTPQQWQNSRLHPPTEADADRAGGIIVWQQQAGTLMLRSGRTSYSTTKIFHSGCLHMNRANQRSKK